MARNTESTGIEAAMELIMQEGCEGPGEAVRTLINEAMRIERSRHLGAGPLEHALKLALADMYIQPEMNQA